MDFLPSVFGGAKSFVKMLPYKVAEAKEGPNSRMFNKLKDKKCVLGITVMDFPGNGLIERIIQTN